MAIAQTQVCILLSLSSLLHSALFNTHGSLIEEMVTNEASNKLKNKLKDSLSDWPEEVIPRLMQYLVELALISIVRRRKCLDDNLRLVCFLKKRKKELKIKCVLMIFFLGESAHNRDYFTRTKR